MVATTVLDHLVAQRGRQDVRVTEDQFDLRGESPRDESVTAGSSPIAARTMARISSDVVMPRMNCAGLDPVPVAIVESDRSRGVFLRLPVLGSRT